MKKGFDVSKICTAYRKELSLNGCSLDVLKSGLQKYIRRGNLEKAVWCTLELYLFVYAKDSNRFEGIITNTLNRLKVTFLEEVNISNPGLLVHFDGLLHKVLKTKEQRKNSTFSICKCWMSLVCCDISCNHNRTCRSINILEYSSPFERS